MTIFTDAKDDTTVLELKKMIEGKTCVSEEIYKNIMIILFNSMLFHYFISPTP